MPSAIRTRDISTRVRETLRLNSQGNWSKIDMHVRSRLLLTKCERGSHAISDQFIKIGNKHMHIT